MDRGQSLTTIALCDGSESDAALGTRIVGAGGVWLRKGCVKGFPHTLNADMDVILRRLFGFASSVVGLREGVCGVAVSAESSGPVHERIVQVSRGQWGSPTSQ